MLLHLILPIFYFLTWLFKNFKLHICLIFIALLDNTDLVRPVYTEKLFQRPIYTEKFMLLKLCTWSHN